MREQPLIEIQASLARTAAVQRRGRTGLDTPSLVATWARCEMEVREAQRLRHAVFAQEMGARLPSHRTGLDVDVFDPYCEHLLVRPVLPDGDSGEVIGTYRVLTPDRARAIHPERGLYSDTEFDLTRLRHLRDRMVEMGRSCVHPQHRRGGAILALWTALAEFMGRCDLDTMIGCASVSMRDGGHLAAALWRQLREQHLAPIEYRVTPRLPLPVEELDHGLTVEAPALIKGYLRLGAKVLGPPAWDPDFNTADFPLLLRLTDLPSRYQRHFGLR